MCNVYPVVWGALAESVGPAKAARQIDMSIKTLANWLIAARGGPPRQNTCRFHSINNPGARMRNFDGTVRTIFQRQSGGAVAAP